MSEAVTPSTFISSHNSAERENVYQIPASCAIFFLFFLAESPVDSTTSVRSRKPASGGSHGTLLPFIFSFIDHELENYVKSFDLKPGFGKMAFRSKVRWSFDSSKVHGLGQVLRRYSDVLHLMISVMAIVEGRRAAFV